MLQSGNLAKFFVDLPVPLYQCTQVSFSKRYRSDYR